MARFDDLIEAQLSGADVRAAGLVEFDFKSAPMRLWQGSGTLDAGGHEWRGIGRLGQLTPIQSGPRGAVEEIKLTLFGDATILANIDADADESIGRACTVYLQFFDVRRYDQAGNWVDWQPLDTMISVFWGQMGPLSVARSEAGAGISRTIGVTVQNAMLNRARPQYSYFSDEDQSARGFADDQMFLQIADFSEGTVRWPIF